MKECAPCNKKGYLIDMFSGPLFHCKPCGTVPLKYTPLVSSNVNSLQLVKLVAISALHRANNSEQEKSTSKNLPRINE